MWFYKCMLLITMVGWTIATIQMRSVLRKHGPRVTQMYAWATTGFGLTATSYLIRAIYAQPGVVNLPAFVLCVGGTFALFIAIRQGSRIYQDNLITRTEEAAREITARFKRRSDLAKFHRGDPMTVITWNAIEKRFCIEFRGDADRDALKAAIKATPDSTICRFETQDSVPVNPTSENIVVLWVSGYTWTDDAAQEALQRVMPAVQKHLFAQPM